MHCVLFLLVLLLCSVYADTEDQATIKARDELAKSLDEDYNEEVKQKRKISVFIPDLYGDNEDEEAGYLATFDATELEWVSAEDKARAANMEISAAAKGKGMEGRNSRFPGGDSRFPGRRDKRNRRKPKNMPDTQWERLQRHGVLDPFLDKLNKKPNENSLLEDIKQSTDQKATILKEVMAKAAKGKADVDAKIKESLNQNQNQNQPAGTETADEEQQQQQQQQQPATEEPVVEEAATPGPPVPTETVKDAGPEPSKQPEPEPEPELEAAVPLGCLGWRQTGGCKSDGDREEKSDALCSTVIVSGWSGFCECEGGEARGRVACEHSPFTCESMCQNPQLDFTPIIRGVEMKALPAADMSYRDLSKNSDFSQLNAVNAHQIIYHVKKPMFLALLSGRPDQDAAFGKIIADLSPQLIHKKLQNKLQFLYMTIETATQFKTIKTMNLQKHNLPTIVFDNILMGPTIEKTVFPMHQAMTVDNMLAFAEKMAATTVKRGGFIPLSLPTAFGPEYLPMMKSELFSTEPPKITSGIQEITVDFESVVMNPEETVVAMVYSPSCGASKAIKPLIEKLAAFVASDKEHDHIRVVSFDRTKNDFPLRGIPLHHYPTIFLFPKDDKQHFHSFDDYNGSKLPHEKNVPHSHYDIENLKSWVTGHYDKNQDQSHHDHAHPHPT